MSNSDVIGARARLNIGAVTIVLTGRMQNTSFIHALDAEACFQARHRQKRCRRPATKQSSWIATARTTPRDDIRSLKARHITSGPLEQPTCGSRGRDAL